MLLIQDVKHPRACLKADGPLQRSSKSMAPRGHSKDGTVPRDSASLKMCGAREEIQQSTHHGRSGYNQITFHHTNRKLVIYICDKLRWISDLGL